MNSENQGMRKSMTTESRNPESERIDQLSSLEIAQLMNREDASVPAAMESVLEDVARAIDAVTHSLRKGGRLIYVGAGTSGRLGVLDASECPPTFNTDPWQVVGIIAGGYGALTRSIEGAEDYPEHAVKDLKEANLTSLDCVVGIATSGRTPYVLSALRYAGEMGAQTIGIACNQDSDLNSVADIAILPIVGPEVVSGSTRLKAGTATKLILNMLTTGAMVRLGKTYGNLMVDLRATNQKLKIRSKRIVCELTEIDETRAQELLDQCGGELKVAILVEILKTTPEAARQLLDEHAGHLRSAIQSSN